MFAQLIKQKDEGTEDGRWKDDKFAKEHKQFLD